MHRQTDGEGQSFGHELVSPRTRDEFVIVQTPAGEPETTPAPCGMSLVSTIGHARATTTIFARRLGAWQKRGDTWVCQTDQTGCPIDLDALADLSPAHIAQAFVQGRYSGESLVTVGPAGVSIVTDPFGVSKIFVSEGDGLRRFASNVDLLRTPHAKADHVACLSMMINGSVINGRTVVSGTRYLDRASIVDASGEAMTTTRYWDFRPSSTGSQASGPHLWDAIVKNVANRCDRRSVLLALTGGYDSATLLGALREIGHRDVICYSYVSGVASAISDAAVAAAQAKRCGYAHFIIDLAKTSLRDIIQAGHRSGQTLRTHPWDITTYADLARRFGSRALMLFGDECMGWNPARIVSREDLWESVALRSPRLWQENSAHLAESLDHLQKDYDALYLSAGAVDTPQQIKDYCYLEHRLQSNILPMRTWSAGSWLSFAIPLLTPAIVDQIAALSPAQRNGKAFYKSVVRSKLPDLFSIPRSTRPQVVPPVAAEVRRRLSSYIQQAGDEKWNVPGFFDTGDFQRILLAASNEASLSGRCRRVFTRVRHGHRTWNRPVTGVGLALRATTLAHAWSQGT